MQSVELLDAQQQLSSIIEHLIPGEEVVITRNDKPVATLRAADVATEKKIRRFGTLKGTILKIAADFDDIPEGFEDYLP